MAQQVDKQHERQLKQLMEHVQCPNGFKCAESEFRDVCRAMDIFGSGKLVMCLEALGEPCGFQVQHGHCTLCNCSVRCYLHKELGV